MQPQTAATLEQLEKADWFTNVGTFGGIQDRSKVILVRSWREAIDRCSSVERDNLSLQAGNKYHQQLRDRLAARYNASKDNVATLKATTEPLVRRKIEAVVREHDLPKVFEDTVQWDILHVCLEAEYADVYQPGFYASQAYWYVKGHFPCGWEGDFPNGTLIVF